MGDLFSGAGNKDAVQESSALTVTSQNPSLIKALLWDTSEHTKSCLNPTRADGMRLLHSGAPSITEFPGGQNSEIKSERSEEKRAEF